MTTSMMQQTRDQFCSCQQCACKVDHGCTHLKTTDKTVRNVILEEVSSLVVYTGPTPHVFVVAIRFALVEDGGSNSPHDDAEHEKGNGKDGVIRGDFLCLSMASFPVGDDDDD